MSKRLKLIYFIRDKRNFNFYFLSFLCMSDDEVEKNNKGNLLFFHSPFLPFNLFLLRYHRIVVIGIVQVLLMN